MSTPVRCPILSVSARTAYEKRGCRCTVCRAANTARSEAARRRRGARVQLRKTPEAVICPRTSKTTATAYRDGCRCATCRDPDAILRRRKRAAAALGVEIDPALVPALEALWAKAYEAFRMDDGYVVEMAEASLVVAKMRGQR